MEAVIEQNDGVQVIMVPGDHLDAGNAREFKEALLEQLQPGTLAVLDLSAVDFVDSSGLGVFLSTLRYLKDGGGDLALCSPRKPVRSLLELVRLQKVFNIYANRTDALQALRKSAN